MTGKAPQSRSQERNLNVNSSLEPKHSHISSYDLNVLVLKKKTTLSQENVITCECIKIV